MRLASAFFGKLLAYRRRRSLPPEFEEAEYLRVNPDVARAVRDGLVRSGADHWRGSGAREGRRIHANDGPALPSDFDENAYLSANPDVQLAFRRGEFPSGASHWLAVGHKDGRSWQPGAFGARHPAWVNEEWDRLSAAADAESLPAWTVCSAALDLGGFDAPTYLRRYEDLAYLSGAAPGGILRQWREEGFRDGRTPFGYRPYRDRKIGPEYWEKDDRISYFGFLDANTGLGQSARNYLSALEKTGIPIEVHKLVDRSGRFEMINTKPPRRGEGQRAGSKVNIFHINADMTHLFFLDDRTGMLDYSYNIGIWFWELPSFPEEWASAFGAFDEIWVASEFVRRSVASLAPIPVVKIPMVVPAITSSAMLPRSYFDISDHVFVFACIFDVGSVIARKNPSAAVQAFKDAFGDRDDVLLLMKCHGGHHYPESLAQLRLLAGSSRNIRFLERDLSEHEMQSFKAAIDCLVSPHRSEGFGLNIAEAMLAGKPVIGTGFSGNMDFMSAENSYLVGYDLRELGENQGPYPAAAVWAEPKIDDVARHMRSAFEERDATALKVQVARRDILAAYNVDTVAHSILRRLEELRLFSPPPHLVATWGRGRDAGTDFYPAVGPRISVIVPVSTIEGRLLHRCVCSVLGQTHANWEIILCNEDSLPVDIARYIDTLRGTDVRIKVSLDPQDEGGARPGNLALELSSGAFLAVLDSCDALAPDALSEAATAILAAPRTEVIYCDEGEIDASGGYGAASATPAGSSDCGPARPLRLLAIRRSLMLQIGGSSAGLVGTHGDLAAQASNAAREIAQVPKALYYCRARN